MGTFRAQLSGTDVAIQNAEDGLSMMQLADSALSQNMDILLRMRDVAVRASTDATLTTSQRQSMDQEIQDLRTELGRRTTAISFNTKILLSGGLSGATLQVGPDNSATSRMSIQIPICSVSDIGGMSVVVANVASTAAAQVAIDIFQSAINGLSKLQSIVGVQEQALERTINDLNSTKVNLAAATSRIQDADMAAEISNFARQQVVSLAATAMIAQANSQPQQVLSLLGIGG